MVEESLEVGSGNHQIQTCLLEFNMRDCCKIVLFCTSYIEMYGNYSKTLQNVFTAESGPRPTGTTYDMGH